VPQFETQFIDCAQSSPVAKQLVSSVTSALTRMELDKKLFHFRYAPRTGQYRVEGAPFRTLDVDLKNIDRRLQVKSSGAIK